MGGELAKLEKVMILTHTHTHTRKITHTRTHSHTLTHTLTYTLSTEMGGELAKLEKVFPNPGTGTAYPPTALPTVGPYALTVPGFVPGSAHRGRRAGGAREGIAVGHSC